MTFDDVENREGDEVCGDVKEEEEKEAEEEKEGEKEREGDCKRALLRLVLLSLLVWLRKLAAGCLSG